MIIVDTPHGRLDRLVESSCLSDVSSGIRHTRYEAVTPILIEAGHLKGVSPAKYEHVGALRSSREPVSPVSM